MCPVSGDVDLIRNAHPDNAANLEELLDVVRRSAGLIPFVGAGLSQPFGFPQWGPFLREQAKRVDAVDAINRRLESGEYEEAAEDLQDRLGYRAFEDAIQRTFRTDGLSGRLPDAAVRALPALASGPVLTTNFDRVLESVFEEAGQRFDDIVVGARVDRILGAVQVHAHLLWKLHGDFKFNDDRVLTRTEYAAHYGNADPAALHWQKPLPNLFSNLLMARPLLFLGCSLQADRTVRILSAFARKYKGAVHYALMEHPGDCVISRARDLSNADIRPIWFPAKGFALIGPFLQYLAGEAPTSHSRADVTSQTTRVERGIEENRQAIASAAAVPVSDKQRVVGQRPDPLDRFRGRETELRTASEQLASPAKRLVSVIAPSGMGKTALAVRVLVDLEKGQWPSAVAGPAVDGVSYHSTRNEGGITFDGVYSACARMIGGQTAADLMRDWGKDQLTIADKIQRLFDALRGGTYVILLDHLEELIDGDGRVTDEGLRLVLDRSLAGRAGPRLIVTSRQRLTLPLEAAKLEYSIPLAELTIADGIALLRDLDRGSGLKTLSDDVLTSIVSRVHGVPRALEVFAGILESGDETVQQLLERFYDRPDVVNDLFKEGITRLDEPARRVVEALAVFGQPVPAAAVDLLLQPFVPGLDTPATLKRLSRSQAVRLADRVKGTWALHPIDQDFAYAGLPASGRYSRQTLHQRAAEWFASVRTPRDLWRTPDGLEPLLQEFDHRVKAGLFDEAAAVLAEFDDEFRGRLGHATRSLAMHLQVQGKITIDRILMLDTLGLAHAYRHIGPITLAIDRYRQSLELARVQHDPYVEAESLGWMGETFRRLGRLDEAADAAAEAVKVARAANDPHELARWLGELSLVSCYRGDLKLALEAAEEGHRVSVESRDTNGEALAVDALALVNLVRGDAAKSVQAAERAIEIYQQSTWETTVIYVLNVQGLAHLELGDIDRAIGCLTRAREEARACEDVRVEGMTSYNLAHAYSLKPDLQKAIESAEDAVRQFTRTGGGELPAARSLAAALRARTAGFTRTEAPSLLEAARASMWNPDLRNPRAMLADAVRLGNEAGLPDVAAQATTLLAEFDASRASVQKDRSPGV